MSDWSVVPLCLGCGERHAPTAPCADGALWFAGRVRCRVCGAARVVVVPLRPGDDPPHDLECDKCGGDTADAVPDAPL